MDDTKFYGLLFYGEKKDKLVKLPIFVNSGKSLSYILETVGPSSKRLSFMATHGTIREIPLRDDKKSVGYPVCIEGKLQFFILKRAGDKIDEKEEKIFLNGKEIGIDIKNFYNSINIIETK